MTNFKNNTQNNQLSKCQLEALNYANKQNTFYDEKTNEILYGRSNLMRASGVSDGTCNQINPMMLRYSARCGAGVAGGNPCFPNSIEPFETNYTNKCCNINGFVTMIFLMLILILFININYYDK